MSKFALLMNERLIFIPITQLRNNLYEQKNMKADSLDKALLPAT